MSIILDRGPRTDSELYHLVRTLWGITIPRHKVCSDHDAPFDAFAAAYFNRMPSILMHGSRGLSGKSRLMSILGLTKAAVLGSDVNIVGGSLNQSINIHNTMRNAWESEHAPKYLIREETATRIRLTNKAIIMPLTASQKTVRGPHPPSLLLDEIDEMDLAIFDASLGQPMPQENWQGQKIQPMTAMTSTWQYPDKTFAVVQERFMERDEKIFRWCVASGTHVLTARGEVPVEEVTDADFVLTRQGWRPVQHVTFMGEKQTLTLRIGKRLLRLTPDHQVAVPDGWAHAVALAAHAVTAPGTDPGVLRSELVSLPAGDLALLEQPRARLVDGWGHKLDVLRVHAATVPAQVVTLEALGDWAYDSLPHPQMCVGGGVGWTVPLGDVLEAVAVSFGTRPVDAVGEHGYELTPVWDLGVEGAHEFVAEGVVVHNCYKDTANPVDGWLDEETIAQKRLEIPAEMWRVEYDLGEPSIGNRAFDTASVERMFSLPEDTIKQKVIKERQDYRFEDPKQDREYVIAADWAQSVDWTVITVADVTFFPCKVVHWTRMRRHPYPVMIGVFNDLMKAYHAEGIHDATGLGAVVADYVDRRARGFLMTGAQRDNMLSEYISSVENDKWRVPRIPVFYKNHLYCVSEGSLVWTLRGDVPIEQVQVGDYAMTRQGWRKVTSTTCNGERRVSRLRTCDGHELLLTPDHSVATGRGWVRAEALQVGDVAFVRDAGAAPSPALGDHQILAGIGMAQRTVGLLGPDPQRDVRAPDVLGVGDILQVVGVDAVPDPACVIELVDDRSDHGPVGDSMGDLRGLLPQSHPGVAQAVYGELPQPASVLVDDHAVQEVLPVDGYTSAHVVYCSPPDDVRKVYDITVEGAHEFFANGIVVHNCSVEQIYSRGKEFHLPDEVCSMALVWRAVSKRAVPAIPVVLAGNNDPTWIEDEMKHNKDAKRKPGQWVVGSVENKSQQTLDELDLTV